MTLTAVFSRKSWAKRKAAKESEKDKLMLMRDDSDIVSFVTWYLKRRYTKVVEDPQKGKRVSSVKDKDVNFVWLGYEAQAHFQNLVKKHPYIATLTGDKFAQVTARRRVYPWKDDQGSWNYWERAEMEDHYKSFIVNEREHNIYGDYSIEKIGPLGKSDVYPACAYLSYAYHEELRWQKITQTLINFLQYTD